VRLGILSGRSRSSEPPRIISEVRMERYHRLRPTLALRRKPVFDQEHTDLAVMVQLRPSQRLRVASIAAMQRSLNRRGACARPSGSTLAAHHFQAGVAQ
jgi:hypothetical protein